MKPITFVKANVVVVITVYMSTSRIFAHFVVHGQKCEFLKCGELY